MRRQAAIVLLPLLSLVIASAVHADERTGLASLPGEVANTARRLEAADKLAAQKEWTEAVEEYQRIISEAGDDLVAVSPRHALAARRLCHCRIAALPAEQLYAYRTRIDAQARKWFEQGAAQRDDRLLKRVVEEAFCSRYGDRALDMLGDLAFERGQFGEAERWWRMIAPLAGDKQPTDVPKTACPTLGFPNPQINVARVRAKQVLARVFAAQNQRNPSDLENTIAAFRGQHAMAEGRLAGRQGNYADTLAAVLQESLTPRTIAETTTWPTFGVDAGRGATATGAAARLRRMCFQPFQWRFSLENRSRLEADAPSPAPEPRLTALGRNRVMAFHPVIVDDYVVVADAHAVVAYALHNGTPSVWYDLAREKEGLDDVGAQKLPAPPNLRYTLTVAGGCVYARLGAQGISAERDQHSYLVCLNLKSDDKGQRLRWLATPDEPGRGAIFEGAPLVHEGRAYIAATRVEGGQTIAAIHCYAANAESAPQLLWRRDVCATQELHGKEQRFRHHLLTLAGSRVVYCSHSGTIVALDAGSGRSVWAVRYPSGGGTISLPATDKDKETIGSVRDLTPCVHTAGRLYVAPADYDGLLCLDAATGATLWERNISKVVHLLGVARGKLIFTTARAIRAVDAATGADAWLMPDVGTFLVPQGRGLIADDLVLWPTTEGLKVLQVDDGRQADNFPPAVLATKLPHERLGNLAYANGCLAVAGPEELYVYLAPGRQRLEREAEVRRQPSSAPARLRLALAQADAGFPLLALDSLQHAAELAAKDQPALAVRTKAEQHGLLLNLSARDDAAQRWNEAISQLEAAARTEFTPAQQAQARVRLAALLTRQKDWPRAVLAWQCILDAPTLRGCRVADINGKPQSAGALAALRINQLVQAHGAAVYASIEQRAAQQLDSAAKELPEALHEWMAQYPNAAIVRELAAKHAKAAGAKRAQPPGTAHATPLNVPLLRALEIDLAAGERLLWPDGPAVLDIADEELYLAAPAEEGGRLVCRDAASGQPLWTAALPFVPSWLGILDSAVLVGGAGGVAGLHRSDGRLLWTFPAASSFASFRVAASRLYFIENHCRLFALDAATGEVLWTRWAPAAGLGLPAPSGCFNPNYLATEDRIVIQTGGGRRWLMDAVSGNLIQDAAMATRQWSQPPLRQGNCIIAATQPHRVVLLDAQTGKELWRYDAQPKGTLTGELPQLVTAGTTLFVLLQRNYGQSIQCLDAATGKPLWPEERLLTTKMLAADQLAQDDHAVYFVAGNVLHAQARADGKMLWRLALKGTERPWRVARVATFVVAYPLNTDLLSSLSLPLVQWSMPYPPLRLLLSSAERSTFPVALVDPSTGQLMQRLNFPLDGLSVAQKLPNLERGVYVSRRGLTVRVPGKACRFAAWSAP
jgi:outer membrane protein assembly factor BamB